MLRPLLTLLSGGAVRQVVALASLPVLARLYDANAFGQLGAIMALVSMTAVMVHGRFHLAIPGAASTTEARSLLKLAGIGSAILTAPLVGVAWLMLGKGAGALTAIAIASGLTLTFALTDVMAYWRSRLGCFTASAGLDAFRALAIVAVQFALVPLGSLGLVLGTLAGASMACLLAALHLVRRTPFRGETEPLRDVAARHRAHPQYGVPQGWAAAASHNLMPLLLLKVGSVAFVGQYWLAYRLLLMPVALINNAYRQAVLPRLRGAATGGSVDMVRQHTLALLAMGLPVAAILMLHGESLLPVALGEGWTSAGTIAGWLGIAFLVDGVKIPTMTLLQAWGRQRTILVWEISVAVLRYAITLPFLALGEPMQAVAAFSLAGSVGWSVFCVTHLYAGRSAAHA